MTSQSLMRSALSLIGRAVNRINQRPDPYFPLRNAHAMANAGRRQSLRVPGKARRVDPGPARRCEGHLVGSARGQTLMVVEPSKRQKLLTGSRTTVNDACAQRSSTPTAPTGAGAFGARQPPSTRCVRSSMPPTPGGPCDRGSRHNRPALPPAVLGHLLPDVAHQHQQLQRARIDPDLHRDCRFPRSASGTFPRPAKWLAWSSRLR
jgi:hypothetical protein